MCLYFYSVEIIILIIRYIILKYTNGESLPGAPSLYLLFSKQKACKQAIQNLKKHSW